VQKRIQERKDELSAKQSWEISVLPEVAQLFNDTDMISSNIFSLSILHIAARGRGHFLLRQLEKDEESKDENTMDVDKGIEAHPKYRAMKEEVEALQLEMKDYFELSEANNKNEGILQKLYSKGIIDKDGNMIG
jgi:hypothetical protein